LEADWCSSNPQDWLNLQTMPSFDYFYKRFHEVAGTILRNHTA
jgi:hypothetical protein